MGRAGLATKVQQPDGKSEAHWRCIGDEDKNKGRCWLSR